MRSRPQEQSGSAGMRGRWGYLATLSRVLWCAHLATLRHFDTKLPAMVKIGPLIPCERRRAKTEISENQEVIFETRFEIRDYDRPFRTFSVTLRRFD